MVSHRWKCCLNDAEGSLDDVKCSLNDAECSLNDAECSLDDAKCSPDYAECSLNDVIIIIINMLMPAPVIVLHI